MSYSTTIALDLGAAATGWAADLTAQLVSTAGANVGAAVTSGFVEVPAGSGGYFWTGTIPAGHQGGVVFTRTSTGAYQARCAVTPQELENADVLSSGLAAAVWAAAGRTLSSAATVTITSPVALDQSLTLYPGDDYAAAESRQPEWSGTLSAVTLAGAGIAFSYWLPGSGWTPAGTGAVVTPTGTQVVRVTFTAAETAAMQTALSAVVTGVPTTVYKLTVTYANAHVAHLVTGTLIVPA